MLFSNRKSEKILKDIFIESQRLETNTNILITSSNQIQRQTKKTLFDRFIAISTLIIGIATLLIGIATYRNHEEITELEKMQATENNILKANTTLVQSTASMIEDLKANSLSLTDISSSTQSISSAITAIVKANQPYIKKPIDTSQSFDRIRFHSSINELLEIINTGYQVANFNNLQKDSTQAVFEVTQLIASFQNAESSYAFNIDPNLRPNWTASLLLLQSIRDVMIKGASYPGTGLNGDRWRTFIFINDETAKSSDWLHESLDPVIKKLKDNLKL